MNSNSIIDAIKDINKDQLLIGISGIHCSGIDEFAVELHEQLIVLGKKVQVIHVPIDQEVINKALLDKNQSKYYYEHGIKPIYLTEQINESLKDNDIVIVSGSLIFKNSLNINFDYKIWIDSTFTTAKKRNNKYSNAILELLTWCHRQHYSIDHPKNKANLVLTNDPLLENEEITYIDFKQSKETLKNLKWLYEPREWSIEEDGILIKTDPTTDFWQRTHYGFRNDNAHMLYIEVEEDFTMTTSVSFKPIHQFDQCGLVVRIDEDNWIKTSIEYELDNAPKLGAVVTNLGYSDWSTEELDRQVYEATFRIIREGQDYKIEVNINNQGFKQLRICHLHSDVKKVKCGIYACSPIDSGYQVLFTDFVIKQNYF